MQREQKKGRNFIWDILILILVYLLTRFIQDRAIPYINTVYHYTANTGGFEGLLEGLFSGSPSSWFSTRLYNFELPQYKGYIAILLAVMVEIVSSDINSYLDFSWLKRKGFVMKAAFRLATSFLFTDFMLALTLLSLLTICPQNMPLLFMVLELLVICLPAALHFFLRKRQKRSPLAIVRNVANVIVIYFAVGHRVIGAILLMAVYLIFDSLEDRLYSTGGDGEDDETDGEDREDGGGAAIFSSIGSMLALLLTIAFIGSIGMVIRPFVEIHQPTINVVHEDIFVSQVTGREYDAVLLRTDGTAVNNNNEVYVENVRQVVETDSNTFFLKNDGEVVVCQSPGQIPAPFLSGILFMSAYRDAFIAVDENGDLWAFGDMANIVPGQGMLTSPQKILENYHLVSADIGKGHILMVDGEGNLFGMGENAVGELGNGNVSLGLSGPLYVMSGIKEAKAGVGVSYALGYDGTMYAWGRNDVGQLGYGVREKSGRKMTYAVNNGETYSSVPRALDFGGAVIRQIAMGAECGFALDDAGQLWVWGKNITRDSIADPQVRRKDVIYISDNKYQSGVIDQRCYYVRTDQQAYRDSVGNMDNYEVNRSELVYDSKNWFPEPVEVTNSYLEKMLSHLPWFREEEEEPLPEEPATSTIHTPKNDYGAHGYLVFEGHTYKIFDEWMFTSNAETYCESMGGHLATITSREEHDFIQNAINARSDFRRSSNFYGIALKYSGGWYWMNGEDTSYIAGLGIKPALDNGKGEGYINVRGKINVGAVTKHPYICEWDYMP